MGYISYLEDIEERFQDTLRRGKGKSSKEIEEISEISDELRQLLDLATSPDIDLACEVESGRRQINSLWKDLEKEKVKAKGYEHKYNECYKKLQDVQHRLNKALADNLELEKKFDRIDRVKLYAAYSSPLRLRKRKSKR